MKLGEIRRGEVEEVRKYESRESRCNYGNKSKGGEMMGTFRVWEVRGEEVRKEVQARENVQ